jgi:hypothetical protein
MRVLTLSSIFPSNFYLSARALNDTLFMMNKSRDKVYLMSVVEDVAFRYTFTVSSAPILMDAQRHIEKSSRSRLQRLGKKCIEHGVDQFHNSNSNQILVQNRSSDQLCFAHW